MLLGFSDKNRRPLDDSPLCNKAIHNERIALDEFFGSLATVEYRKGALGRIPIGTGSDEESASVKLVEAGTVRREMSREIWHGLGRYIVKSNVFHRRKISGVLNARSCTMREYRISVGTPKH